MVNEAACPSFLELQRAAREASAGRASVRLAVLGDSSTQHLSAAIQGYSILCGEPMDVFDADYDQITAQLMDKTSEIHQFKPDVILFSMCTEKLYERWCAADVSQRQTFAEAEFARIRTYWKAGIDGLAAKVIQLLFVENDDEVFGNFSLKAKASFYFQLKKLNWMLVENCPKEVFLIDLNKIRSRQGAEAFDGQKMYYMAKLAFSLKALPYIAKYTNDIVRAIRGNVRKCVVLDLDNTIWGG